MFSAPGRLGRIGRASGRRVVAAALATSLPQTANLVARWSADDIPAQTDNTALTGWTSSVGSDALAQGTAAAQPKYRTTGLNGKPFVQFSGAQRLELAGGAAFTACSTAGAASTTFVVFRNTTGTNALGQLFGSNATNLGNQLNATSTLIGIGTNTATRIPFTHAAGSMETTAYGNDTTTGSLFGGHFYVRGCRLANGQPAKMGGTGISIGGNPAQTSWAYTGEIYEVLVWNKLLSAAEVMQVEKWARDKYGQAYPWAGAANFRIFDGDSQTNGLAVNNTSQTYPYILAGNKSWPIGTWANMAKDGTTWDAMQTDATSGVDALRTMVAKPIQLTTFEYFNQAKTSGITGAQLWAKAVTYLQARRSAGHERIILGSSVDSGSNASGFAGETLRSAYNQQVTDNWATYAEAFASLHTNTNVGVDGACPDTSAGNTYFQTDSIHLKQPGNAELATMFGAQIT